MVALFFSCILKRKDDRNLNFVLSFQNVSPITYKVHRWESGVDYISFSNLLDECGDLFLL